MCLPLTLRGVFYLCRGFGGGDDGATVGAGRGAVQGVVGDGDDGAQAADADDHVQRAVEKHVPEIRVGA